MKLLTAGNFLFFFDEVDSSLGVWFWRYIIIKTLFKLFVYYTQWSTGLDWRLQPQSGFDSSQNHNPRPFLIPANKLQVLVSANFQ